MEIHARYYEAATVPRNDPVDYSDKMFELIRNNRVKALLNFFKSLPPAQLSTLVNRRNEKYGNALPINFAIKSSANHFIFIMLLRLGARFDDPVESPLVLAVRSGLMNFVKILLISGADVNILDPDGYSILHWACFQRNSLMVRLILKLLDFTFHNNDRNSKRISPLGIAVDLKSAELVRELLKCPKIDPNIIDSRTHRYVYDLAAEASLYNSCIEMELAFTRNNFTNRRFIKTNFHDLHEYSVEMVVQHQLRSQLFKFQNDPRGPFESFTDPTIKLPFLPNQKEWQIIKADGSLDSTEGWIYGRLTDKRDNPLAINYSGKEVIMAGSFFRCMDNYRYRFMARRIKRLVV